MLRYFRAITAIIILIGLGSCGGGKMATENEALVVRVTELEHMRRILRDKE